MYEKNNFIQTESTKNDEDPLEKLNISLNQLLFSLKNKEPFLSSETDTEIKSENEEINNEEENLLKQFDNLHNMNSHVNINFKKKEKNKKNIKEILGKIKEIKNENNKNKNEMKEFNNIFNQMIKVIIEGTIMKETELKEKYKNIINKIKKELESTKKKMNKNSIDYKKRRI